MASSTWDLEFRPSTYWPGAPVAGAGVRGDGLPLLGSAPGFGDGSYLPDLAAGEVEIASVGLESTTGDVISVSARRVGDGIMYRIVDEYDSSFEIHEPLRGAPLSLGELVDLMDTVDHDGMIGLLECYLDLNYDDLDDAADPHSLIDFVQVRSSFYPGLEQLYEARAQAWVDSKVAELGD